MCQQHAGMLTPMMHQFLHLHVQNVYWSWLFTKLSKNQVEVSYQLLSSSCQRQFVRQYCMSVCHAHLLVTDQKKQMQHSIVLSNAAAFRLCCIASIIDRQGIQSMRASLQSHLCMTA